MLDFETGRYEIDADDRETSRRIAAYSRDRPGVYDGEILALMAERGEICFGHRVSFRDESDDSRFDCVLIGGDTPVERAVRGRSVGDRVTVGGAY
ncbi:MAG: hypothetical protein H7145_03245 [Akkermansiaceae bacterium]|nr:hypothetical protein [Armatimonadota bacterium]